MSWDGNDYADWLAARKKRPVRVYVISSGEFVKVGIAADVNGRLREHQVGNPVRLKLEYQSKALPRPQAERAERTAAIVLKRYHVSGEWFSCSVVEAIDAVKGACRKVRGAAS